MYDIVVYAKNSLEKVGMCIQAFVFQKILKFIDDMSTLILFEYIFVYKRPSYTVHRIPIFNYSIKKTLHQGNFLPLIFKLSKLSLTLSCFSPENQELGESFLNKRS